MLQNIEKDVRVWEKRTTQHRNEESVRALGIHMSPAFNWDKKFHEVKIKMEGSIGNFFNTLMTVQLMHLHVNSHLMSKVYFGCGIMHVTDTQDKELIRMYEKSFLREN